jgi:hypothetical protein
MVNTQYPHIKADIKGHTGVSMTIISCSISSSPISSSEKLFRKPGMRNGEIREHSGKNESGFV